MVVAIQSICIVHQCHFWDEGIPLPNLQSIKEKDNERDQESKSKEVEIVILPYAHHILLPQAICKQGPFSPKLATTKPTYEDQKLRARELSITIK